MDNSRLIDYDIAYMKIAMAMGELSHAIRYKVGCIIVSKKGQIISQGYNGMPSGYDNQCEEVECSCNWVRGCCVNAEPIEKMKSLEHCKNCKYCKLLTKKEVLHAESNAISKCAKWNSSTDDATLYVTLSPCVDCSKLIIQSGIKRLVYLDEYRNIDGIKMLNKVGIKVQQIDIENKSLKDIYYEE
jgi:dCMP deaminase